MAIPEIGSQPFSGHMTPSKLRKRKRRKTELESIGLNTVPLIQTQSAEARTIQRRHSFFARKMLEEIRPTPLDKKRLFGELEREIVYYRDEKKCQVCGAEIRWPDLETHHVEEHQVGGLTSVENAVSVHKGCHPKGQKAEEFRIKWLTSKKPPIDTAALLQKLTTRAALKDD